MHSNTPSPQYPSKAHYLVSMLEKSEKKKFNRWLNYELNGTNEPVIELYGWILDGKSIDEIIVAKWGIDINKDDNKRIMQQFHGLANQLVKLLEEFLVIEKWSNDKLKQEMELVRIYNERAANHLILPTLNKARKTLDEASLRNSDYFQYQYKLETELRAYSIMNPLRKSEFKRKVKRGEIENYVQAEELKKEFQVGQKQEDFRRQCFLYAFLLKYWDLNVQKYAQTGISDIPLDKAIEGLEEKDLFFGFNDVYQLYKMVHTLFKFPETKEEDIDWQDLQSKLEHARKILPSADWVNLIRMLINYQNKKVLKKVNVHTYKNLLLLHEISMRSNTQQVDSRQYKNIITICANLSLLQEGEEKKEALKKANNYLTTWKNYLPSQEGEEAFQLSKMIYDFGCEKYQEILEYDKSRQGRFSYVHNEISYRFIVLQAKYESLPARRELINECNNLKRFIERTKLSELSSDRKDECRNRLKLFRQFIQAYTKREFLNVWNSMQETFPLSWPWFYITLKGKTGISD